MNTSSQALSPLTTVIGNLIRSCCVHPDRLELTERTEGRRLRIFARPDGRDHPILVGRLGRTVSATHMVALEAGKKFGFTDVSVDIIHSYEGVRGESKSFTFNPLFDAQVLRPVLEPFLAMVYGKGWEIVSIVEDNDRVKVILDLPATELGLVMALGSCLYPFGFRLGRKLSFRIKNLTAEQVNGLK